MVSLQREANSKYRGCPEAETAYIQAIEAEADL